jgi:hypothetical protein
MCPENVISELVEFFSAPLKLLRGHVGNFFRIKNTSVIIVIMDNNLPFCFNHKIHDVDAVILKL